MLTIAYCFVFKIADIYPVAVCACDSVSHLAISTELLDNIFFFFFIWEKN